MKLLITFVLTLLFCLSAHAQVPTAEELDQMYRDAHRRVESCAVIYRQKPYVREMGAIVPDPRDKWFAELRGCTKRARESVDLLTLGVMGALNEKDRQVSSQRVAQLVSDLWYLQAQLANLQEKALWGAMEVLFDAALFNGRMARADAMKAFRAYQSATNHALQACGALTSLKFQARKRHEAELLRALKSIEQSLSIRVSQEWLRYFQGR